MLTSDFDFKLPQELIAQRPLSQRSDSRLLHCNASNLQLHDCQFKDLLSLLNAGDLLVMNDTRVFPARIFGTKESGGKVEILIERLLSDTSARCLMKSSRSPKSDASIYLDGGLAVKVIGREDDLFIIETQQQENLLQHLEHYGHMPLPPYIERQDDAEDAERYQTVFADKAGAVAAPTAGLHFDDELLTAIEAKGIQKAFITLNVGPGTFQPVRAEKIDDHVLHSEFGKVNDEVAKLINQTKANGKRVIAVGTTVVRTLESAFENSKVNAFADDTNLFIKPGFEFNVIDGLITNFHLPKSSLLMLVSALAGYDFMMQAYQHAVEAKYRFFSYGDAMFIET